VSHGWAFRLRGSGDDPIFLSCLHSERQRRIVQVSGFKTVMLMSALTALFMALGYTLGGSGGAVIALLAAAGMNLFTFSNAHRVGVALQQARGVGEAGGPDLVGLVRDRSQRAGRRMPRVYLIDEPPPNAFAPGGNPDNAAVAAATGLL